MATKTELRTCMFYDPDAEKEHDEEYGCMGEFDPGQSDSPYCPRCKANMYYWMRAEKARPGSMRRYRNKLHCRHARLDQWASAPREKTGKVIQITNARRRRHG